MLRIARGEMNIKHNKGADIMAPADVLVQDPCPSSGPRCLTTVQEPPMQD